MKIIIFQNDECSFVIHHRYKYFLTKFIVRRSIALIMVIRWYRRGEEEKTTCTYVSIAEKHEQSPAPCYGTLASRLREGDVNNLRLLQLM